MKRGVPSTPDVAPTKKPRAGHQAPQHSQKGSVWVEIPSRKRVIQKATRYIPTGDETNEEDVELVGETTPESSEEDEDTVPVRKLQDFSIFDAISFEYVPATALLSGESRRDWVGAGIVSPYIDDNDDYDDDSSSDPEVRDTENILLSPILEVSVHHVVEDYKNLQLDPKIYIRTRYGWYILLNPARGYMSYYQDAWIHHFLAHTVFSAILEDQQLTVVDLQDRLRLPAEDLNIIFLDLTSRLSVNDLTSSDFVTYLGTALDGLADNWPTLYDDIVGSSLFHHLYPSLVATARPPTARSCKRRLKDEEKDVLLHRDITVVTPRVGAIARKLFSQALHVVQLSTDPEAGISLEPPVHKVHVSDPVSVEWLEGTTNPHIFSSVSIDGTVYSAGDIVIVEPGDDTAKSRAKNAGSLQARCPGNHLANTKWFCKICYFFEKEEQVGSKRVSRKFFHAQWLQHGAQTLLQEAAHSKGLFWLKECDDLLVECIYSHCNVVSWPSGEVEPLKDNSGHENNFFAGLTLDGEDHSFVQRSPEEIEQAIAHCETLKPCVPCGLSKLEDERDQWTLLPEGGVSHQGLDYHVHDFVYVHNPKDKHGLLAICQILDFLYDRAGRVCQLRVCKYGRYDHVAQQFPGIVPRDNRRLFKTEVVATVDVTFVEGKAFVSCPSSPTDKEAWASQQDHFYCDLCADSLSPASLEDLHPAAIPVCDRCYASALDARLEEEHIKEISGRLRGLELFAGAGGLSTGLELSGYVQTRWAVEFSPAAAQTYRVNHPHAVVYNESSTILLKHAVQTADGLNPAPLFDKCNEVLPPLPQRGEVDFIYGGPPCQSFSLMNHHRRADDPRHTLVCNMISYVEFYRPMFFLLENVVGLLSSHLHGKSMGKNSTGVSMGVVKFILRALTALGYQVHFKVLQAGQHGAPQGRRRVIFLGARRDVPLPAFPIPQHAYPIWVHNIHLPNGEVLYPQYRSIIEAERHQCASLPTVTVYDAISDLPRFDWEDPHVNIPQKRAHQEDVQARINQDIPSFKAVSSSLLALPGFSNPKPYFSQPLSRYQSWVRAGCGELVSYQYTRRCSPDVVECVVNIPMRPNADYTDLPKVLQKRTSNKNTKALYGRLDANGHFVTAMTTINPNAKGGKVVHSDQKRILTIRECARAQGFPDSYQFISYKETAKEQIGDQMRQIGNAVPVPLALALGKELGKALVKFTKQRRQQEQRERGHSPELV